MVQCRNQGGFPRVESVVMPALAVYVHLPWCVRKCPYCDFNSHRAPRLIPQDRYVDALLADLRADLDLAGGRRVDTVLVGGGTPSLMPPGAVVAQRRRRAPTTWGTVIWNRASRSGSTITWISRSLPP